MDITSLKTVLLVETHGSFAGAARTMSADPSSVSRVVANVEAELGIRLFQRTTRRLTVTEEGHIYLQKLAPLLDEMAAAKEAALGHRRHPKGVLKMTASVAFSCELIVPLLPAFRDLYPDITVDLNSSDANLDLIEHGIDLAVRLAPAPKGDLISSRLMKTTYKVVASPAYLARHPVAGPPSVLKDHECLRFALPGFQDHWHFERVGGTRVDVPISGKSLFSNALALRDATRCGMGIALLADWLVQDDLRSGRLTDVFPDVRCTATDFDTAAWLLYPSRTYLPSKVRVMIDFLRGHLAA
ncbi:LysR family transcriptional regulator [uncultured Roseobacter sp.]|uniref:LysR family transcriptional regulator n=1 Tax=uncultured Roseobacter sp. TaxID=114847 RepID=UPI00260AD221|nr:LysR family transcriptional regulator [uncultured Roseobacter sp.]